MVLVNIRIVETHARGTSFFNDSLTFSELAVNILIIKTILVM